MMCCNVWWSLKRRLFFRSGKLLAGGIRNAFDRETGRRPLRKARRGQPGKNYVVRAVFFGSVENGGIHRRLSKAGMVSDTSPEKQLGVPLGD